MRAGDKVLGQLSRWKNSCYNWTKQVAGRGQGQQGRENPDERLAKEKLCPPQAPEPCVWLHTAGKLWGIGFLGKRALGGPPVVSPEQGGPAVTRGLQSQTRGPR